MVIRVQPSARLSFSLLSDQDADLMFEVDQDEDVMRYLNGGKRTSMQQIIDVMLPRLALYRKPELGYGIWQVRRTDDNAYMGWVLIRPMGFDTETPSNNDVEIGWRFKKPFWGQGYASEAAAAVANAVVKANPKVRYLSATAMVENAGSIGVMRKLGMHFIKRYRHKDALGEVDAVLYRKEISSSC